MSDARVIEVCDAVVQRILDNWAVTGNDEVSRQYLTPVKMDSIVGRKVYVFPADYVNAEPMSRSDDLNEYRLALLVIERYATQGTVPKVWLDERVRFVEQFIWQLLTNVRKPLLLGTLWPQSADVNPVYDVAVLNENKVFWSEIEIVYREVAEAP